MFALPTTTAAMEAKFHWRPDKAAAQCTMGQVAPALRPAELAAIVAA